ncbi:CoA transferase [Microbacterium sp. NIBRBAC000506063]|nr:CoA transferase [Microbacterium sp. NIBRBAC000506063]
MRVVDFSTHLSGPMASHLLAETGVDVVKVEHPVIGDGNRGMSPKIAGVGDFHVGLNSGVRSLAASTRSEHWPALLEACARWADAVIVGSRPSDARRRGLDFASLAQHNDRLVYTAISGYGIRGRGRSSPLTGRTSTPARGRCLSRRSMASSSPAQGGDRRARPLRASSRPSAPSPPCRSATRWAGRSSCTSRSGTARCGGSGATSTTLPTSGTNGPTIATSARATRYTRPPTAGPSSSVRSRRNSGRGSQTSSASRQSRSPAAVGRGRTAAWTTDTRASTS